MRRSSIRPAGSASSPSRLVSRALGAVGAVVAGLLLAGCGEERREVVVYCALDQEHAVSILEDFEKKTGIHVAPQFDDEITKTVGLAARLKAEKEHPKADVFWNNEIVNTIRIEKAGCLAPYVSPSAADIPAQWKQKDGLWTGFAARARILIVNTEKCPPAQEPRSYKDFVDPARKGQAAIARPVAGTTATHLAVLFDRLGVDAAKAWWTALEKNDTGLLSGNGPVMKEVRAGNFAWGFTDTDDFFVALVDNYPVKSIYPDQGEGELGCLVIPNTISLIKGCRHEADAKTFIDYVLSREVEQKLADGRSAQIPVRADIPTKPHVKRLTEFKVMQVDFERAAGQFDAAQEWLTRPK